MGPWIQSTSLLAILAGYSLLLLFAQGLLQLQRDASHRLIVEQLRFSLQSRHGASTPAPQHILGSLNQNSLLRIRLSASPPSEAIERAPTQIAEHGQLWLRSTVSVESDNGTTQQAVIDQNITEYSKEQQKIYWLFIAAGGASALFSSLLMRLVLQRGLRRPIQELSSQLHRFQAPPTRSDVIDVESQPKELQPIAHAFNQLQARILVSWDQQKLFTDGVAHELRTPITLISGYAQKLGREAKSLGDLQPIALIIREAERMSSLINDLLDLARNDSGRLQLISTPIAGEDALIQLHERMALQSQGRLQIRLDPNEPEEVTWGTGDPDRVQQCLTALVDNALRYSPPGTLVILSSSQGSDGSLILHVCDQGSGVPESERTSIFERFTRGSAALNHKGRGSGIGLSIVKILMEAMGGCVKVETAPGGGADFQLHLHPLKPSDHQS